MFNKELSIYLYIYVAFLICASVKKEIRLENQEYHPPTEPPSPNLERKSGNK